MAQTPIKQDQLETPQGTTVSGAFGRQTIYKGSDETRTSTESETADADFDSVFVLEANKNYSLHGVIIGTDSFGGGGLSINLRLNSGSAVEGTIRWAELAGGNMVSGPITRGQTAIATADFNATVNVVELLAVIEQGSVEGTLEFWWAQKTSNGTASEISLGSHLILTEL